MNPVKLAFEAYRKLGVYDEQIVFRDILRRLYTPIQKGWGFLSVNREIKPDKEYLDNFYLNDFKTNRDIRDIELIAMKALEKTGIISNLKSYIHILTRITAFFHANSSPYHSFKFDVPDKDLFFAFHDMVFNGEGLSKLKPQLVDSRAVLEFNDISRKLIIKSNNAIICECKDGSNGYKVLYRIFIENKNIINTTDLNKCSKGTTMTGILANMGVKGQLKDNIFETGRGFIKLKNRIDLDGLKLLLEKNS